MKQSTYLKRLKNLDHQFLMGKLTQKQYATKRNKLSKQWVKSQLASLSAEYVNKNRSKFLVTHSIETARRAAKGKKKIYRLPNGVYAVRK